MTYYSLRITHPDIALFDPSDIWHEETKDQLWQPKVPPKPPPMKFIQNLIDMNIVPYSQYIMAIEKKDKYLEECNIHLHFCFSSILKKKTLQDKIRKAGFVGNKCYSLSRHDEIDPIRFYQYCLKEKDCWYQTNIDPDVVKSMIICAVSEREQAAIHWKAKREKAMSKDSLADRLCLDISNNSPPLEEYREIYIFILNWYVEKKKGICHQTIQNHVNLYRLQKKIITTNQFYEAFHNEMDYPKNFFSNLVL